MPPVTPIFPKQNYRREPIAWTSPQIGETDGRQKDGFDCLSIARHVEHCPICSKLYDTDKTLYILAILGLLILCFLMVKRIVKL